MVKLSRYILTVLSIIFASSAVACDGVELDRADVFDAPLCIPQTPRRVVVLDPSFGLGVGLDVGLPVVGAPLDLMSDEALLKRAMDHGITSTGFVTEPSLETIVALQPDLIVGFVGSESMASGIYPMATRVAPTLLFTSTDWRAFYRLLAGLGGKEQEIVAELDTLDQRIADIQARMPETTVSVLRITSWDFQVYMDAPETYAPFEIMKQAGVRRSAYETTDDPSLTLKRPDREELAQLDGDILLYIVGGTNASDQDGRHEEVLNDPLWQMLPAVRAGQVHRVSHGAWMQFSGVASAHRVLDDLETYVVGSP
ncbi:iron-siderophore ABC transporter substrate-binding protein [Pseudorhodobacter aquimaris]|uniref:iron-siderophore ABC transporter substrate-binding protein n=1 Tax=Pseudorhodobacter aquimaris TaxID=687412 RepID=UPI0018DBAA60|nr:iron-siderophore ABC transporter substrate-binding protein [Pseudorhodobacter aquimaris]